MGKSTVGVQIKTYIERGAMPYAFTLRSDTLFLVKPTLAHRPVFWLSTVGHLRKVSEECVAAAVLCKNTTNGVLGRKKRPQHQLI